MIFAQKLTITRILHDNCPKNSVSPIFFWGGGIRAPLAVHQFPTAMPVTLGQCDITGVLSLSFDICKTNTNVLTEQELWTSAVNSTVSAWTSVAGRRRAANAHCSQLTFAIYPIYAVYYPARLLQGVLDVCLCIIFKV